MCIKLVNAHYEKPYDVNVPLELQLDGFSQIIVDYKPFDKEVDQFVKEVERFARTGIRLNSNIEVIHNDDLIGYKAFKKLRKATSDITLNEIIKLMVLSHVETDKKLEELANTFTGK